VVNEASGRWQLQYDDGETEQLTWPPPPGIELRLRCEQAGGCSKATKRRGTSRLGTSKPSPVRRSRLVHV